MILKPLANINFYLHLMYPLCRSGQTNDGATSPVLVASFAAPQVMIENKLRLPRPRPAGHSGYFPRFQCFHCCASLALIACSVAVNILIGLLNSSVAPPAPSPVRFSPSCSYLTWHLDSHHRISSNAWRASHVNEFFFPTLTSNNSKTSMATEHL